VVASILSIHIIRPSGSLYLIYAFICIDKIEALQLDLIICIDKIEALQLDLIICMDKIEALQLDIIICIDKIEALYN
jgi:hypothetical protein